ncbi:MAG TPA: hypothetical protein VL403_04265, partial [Candidatus Kryptonia bacterium]|nr:hypothetical protein [Candidatus Kryptonia bacterium]
MLRVLPVLMFMALLAATRASAGTATSDPPTYVGRAVCAPCHTREAVQYAGSHHDRAMQPA